MKVRVERAEFRGAVDWLREFTRGTTHLAALRGIHVTAADGLLVLRATDLESAGKATVAAAVDEPGVALPSASLLGSLVGKLPDGGVSLAKDTDALAVEAGRVAARVPLLAEDDFPQPPDVEDDRAVTIPCTIMEQIAKRIAPVVYTKPDKPAYTAVHLILRDGKLTAAASDTYRVHRLTVDLDSELTFDVLLPTTVFGAVAKLGVPVTVSAGEGIATFSTDEHAVTTTVVAGSQMDPDAFFARVSEGSSLRMEREPLAESMARIVAFSAGAANVPASLQASDGALHITSTDGATGSITDSLPCEGEGSVTVNPGLLAQAIDALGTDEVELALTDGLRPIGVRSPEGASFDALVMPMKE